MAKKFTDLNELTIAASDDVIAIVDTSANETKRITIGNLLSNFIDAVHIKANAIITSKILNGAVTTAKFKPTVINSNFTKAGSRYNKTTTGWAQIPNCSMTYTAGDTPERLLLRTSAMAMKASSGNGEIALYVDGVAYGIRAYYDWGTPWYRCNFDNVLDLAAGQTVTLALYAYASDTAGFFVTNEQDYWKPTITGMAVYNGA